MTTFLVAAIQMDTTSNQDQNLSVVADFIGEAAKKGAQAYRPSRDHGLFGPRLCGPFRSGSWWENGNLFEHPCPKIWRLYRGWESLRKK